MCRQFQQLEGNPWPHFHPYHSFQCYFDSYVVCILGSKKSHLCLNLFLSMATLQHVSSLITPVEWYRQAIYWFLNADSGTGKICLGFSGFHFCLRVLVFSESRACALQGGPGVRGAKGHRGDPGPKVLFKAHYIWQMHGFLAYLCCMETLKWIPGCLWLFWGKSIVKCHWHLLWLFPKQLLVLFLPW